MEKHYLHSSYREKLIEHLLIGKLLKISWRSGDCDLEVAKPEVDNKGYDIILERGGLIRHVQLKASHWAAKTPSQKLHLDLASKPSGCTVWVQFDEDTLTLGPFLFFGSPAGCPLPSLEGFQIGKHTKANAQGVKAERKALRVVPRRWFREVASVEALYDLLFDPAAMSPRVFEAAAETLGDRDKACRWLAQPLPALGGRAPSQILIEPDGEARVLEVLARIEHGVYG